MAGREWTNDELKASVDVYVTMLAKQFEGKRFNKRASYRGLAERFGRSAKSFERRMQNISFLLHRDGKPWVKGLLPMDHVGNGPVATNLQQMLAEVELPTDKVDPRLRSELQSLGISIDGMTDEQAAAAIGFANDPEFANETPTSRERLINARLGQGTYRQKMLEKWDRRCAVTGCAVEAALIASHAIPWKECTNKQRLDPYNGLPLIATLDALFDSGLIAFADTGDGLISDRLSGEDRKLLGLQNGFRLRKVFEQNKPYLTAHRQRSGF